MNPLDRDLRSMLEKTVKAARGVAETAALAAVEQLGVGQDKPEAFLSDAQRRLRNRLRTHGKQLGDARDSKSTNPTYGRQGLAHLVQEVAYEHWHRMLFARFLADNDLLMYDGVAVTVDECDELAADECAKNGWELAGRLAARMLPQVFKPGSPVFELNFAAEHQMALERLVKALPDAVFKASDSLGWVYQFWQADNKDRINKSEVKIGADELPAVTQLFTEPYMVAFLLHNSLGAWWATRHPGKACPVDLDYFRTLEDGTPAAGRFDGWPDSLAQFKLLDPCCGSGHFLVAAFLMLVPMRMAAEGLGAKDAVDQVLADNLHGLEIDPRCVEIAVFAVALEAWRYPDASGKPLGVREIPAPNIACCGLTVAATVQDWEALVLEDAPDAEHLREGLRRLHETFMQAPLLGSLLDPRKVHQGDLFAADYSLLGDLLDQALAGETAPPNESLWDSALSARGLLDAARLLDARYHFIITNVPYLARGKQHERLRAFCETHYSAAKHDLATVFLDRCLELCLEAGTASLVMPQNWLFLTSYKAFREKLLKNETWRLIARLGPGAFETISGEVVKAILISLSRGNGAPEATNDELPGFESLVPFAPNCIGGIDVSESRCAAEKAVALASAEIKTVRQTNQLDNPDSIISLDAIVANAMLSDFASSIEGLSTGDNERFLRRFHEQNFGSCIWEKFSGAPENSGFFGGMSYVLRWENGEGDLVSSESARIQGASAWKSLGVIVGEMNSLPRSLYLGDIYVKITAAIIPKQLENLPAIWAYCSDASYVEAMRLINQKLSVATATLVKVPFDLAHWQQVAAERYPHGLPQPYSDDPTQWIFHGHPCGSVVWDENAKWTAHGPLRTDATVLQVAVARLLGYRWPAELDAGMELAEEQRAWVERCEALWSYVDQDGIVCIPPAGQEAAASDRLLNLLAAAYGDDWSNDILAQLLTAADHAGKTLDTWLREKFFVQHCKLFGNRPFVWQVWDGLRDGFAALVNYHTLDYKGLESLIYTYLGDWIGRQKRDQADGVDGAQERLAAAEVLKRRLELILEGEAPYDIFVRWKPIEQQPIGWNPDLNDGVRLNIRPFLSVHDIGKRGAGVLRDKPNIKWDKDRGTDVPSAPWYALGPHYGGKVGDRINDHHLTLAEKRAARDKKGA